MQLAICLLAAVLANVLPETTLRSVVQVRSLQESEFSGRPFEITGQVVANLRVGSFVLQDATGGFDIRHGLPSNPELGSVITVVGKTRVEVHSNIPFLEADTIRALRKEPLPAPRDLPLKRILNGECDFQLVTTSGVVFDAFPDEIDPEWNYLIVRRDEDSVYVAVFDPAATMRKHLDRYVDTEIRMSGVGMPSRAGWRAFTGPYLLLQGESDIRILEPPPTDPFALPPLEDLLHARPEKIAAMRRRTVSGWVLASWGKGNFLLKDDKKRILRVECADSAETPVCGDSVKVVGFPTTDLYRLNLTHARVRRLASSPSREPTQAIDTKAAEIMVDDVGKKKIKPLFHGRFIRMRGVITAMPSEVSDNSRLIIDSDGYLFSVELSAIPKVIGELGTGCCIDVSGICVMDTSNWRPNNVFPTIGNIILVPRKADDIQLVSRPSWWTASRLLSLVGTLFAALLGITIWNFSLRRLAEQRGRELFRSEIEKASAELRISERTRLAVELHDSIAQNLTGAFFQVEAADLARETDPAALEHCLKSAMRTLQSCREELRYCLCDLRNNVLDETDAVDVLRRTLSPHSGSAKVTIDANLPRPRISDNTFHTLLRIARELVSNAVRHGKARNIAVSAQFEQASLVLTVADDGCGFDPGRRLGPDDGHFGLRGIEDRIRKMSGHLKIKSRPDHGAVITVTFTPDQPNPA